MALFMPAMRSCTMRLSAASAAVTLGSAPGALSAVTDDGSSFAVSERTRVASASACHALPSACAIVSPRWWRCRPACSGGVCACRPACEGWRRAGAGLARLAWRHDGCGGLEACCGRSLQAPGGGLSARRAMSIFVNELHGLESWGDAVQDTDVAIAPHVAPPPPRSWRAAVAAPSDNAVDFNMLAENSRDGLNAFLKNVGGRAARGASLGACARAGSRGSGANCRMGSHCRPPRRLPPRAPSAVALGEERQWARQHSGARR